MASVFKPSNIEPSLLEAPLQDMDILETELQQPEEIEIITETESPDGSVQIDFELPEESFGGEPESFFDNLVPLLSDQTLNKVSSQLRASVQDDKTSRKDWEETYTNGLDLLGLKYENRSQPFEGATGVIHPLLNEAVTQFQAGAYKEMLPSSGPVRAQVVGAENPETIAQAQRVQEYLNYILMHEMEEYEPEFDQMLYFLGLAGSAFKKLYFDDVLGRPVSKFVPAEDVVVPYTATDLKSAERVTHIIKISENDLRKQQVSGFYADMELKGGSNESTDEITEKYNDLEGLDDNDNDTEYTLLECHCYLDLEEYPDTDDTGEQTDIKLPYIVTVCKDTKDVLSIRRNYTESDPMKNTISHFVQYKFSPGLGFYGFGLIHLMGNLSRTATANLRQLIDAGTLANMPAGFKARGIRIANEGEPLSPGEFRDVDVPGGDLRTSLMPLPYKEPSGTLFQLMGFVVEAAQRFIGTTDLAVGDGSQETPVGTTIALLERGSKVVSSVHKRLHASMKHELKMLARLISEDPKPYPYEVNAEAQIKSSDFDNRVDILPVSDPNIFSMSQRVMLAQEQLKLANSSPVMHNMYEAYKRVYQALGVNNIDQILKPEPAPEPIDPATENQTASTVAAGQGQLKAFAEQDHDSHITVHQAYMGSKVAQMQPSVLLTLEKHIFEHIGLKAQTIHDQQMQQNQQAQQQPPEQHANMVAQIQAQLMSEYMQANPPQQEQDPLVEIKRQELQMRQMDLEADNQLDQQKLQLDQQRLNETSNVARERIQSTEGIANMRAQIARERQAQNANGKTGQ